MLCISSILYPIGNDRASVPGLNRRACEARSLKPIAVSALCLYLLVHLFLILCLVHPHNAHLKGQADGHPVSVCAWAHKTVSSHVPSSWALPPLAVAVLLALVPLPQLRPESDPIRLAGRSPPLFALK